MRQFIPNTMISTIAIVLVLTSNCKSVWAESNYPKSLISDNQCEEFTFDAYGFVDSNNKNIVFNWDFNDDTTSQQSIVQHSYADPGEYQVQLTVQDISTPLSKTTVYRQLVKTRGLASIDFVIPQAVCTEEEKTYLGVEKNISNYSQPEFIWDFGDGTEDTGKEVKHHYLEAGEFEITLTVDDGLASSCSEYSKTDKIQVNAPPKAIAGEDINMLCIERPHHLQVDFDASNSYDDNFKDQLAFIWDFGDGTSQEGIKVAHQYQRLGNYTATLTVKDNSGLTCNTGQDQVKVLLELAALAEAGESVKACPGAPIDFNGAVKNVPVSSVIPSWDFADGFTQAGFSARHSYKKGGDYEAKFNVNDKNGKVCEGNTATRLVRINEPPSANSGSDITKKCLATSDDLWVTLNASGTQDINEEDEISYFWDFGDGTAGTGRVIDHRYPKSGDYVIKLLAKDNSQLSCNSSTDQMNVSLRRAPRADAGSDVIACVGDKLPFDGSGSFAEENQILMGRWSYGDGRTERGIKTLHAYKEPGTYRAQLQVRNAFDDSCPFSPDERIVTVNAAPKPQLQVSTTGRVAKSIIFDGSASIDGNGYSLTYYWDFGDGTAYFGRVKERHTYQETGDYTVTLTVDDDQQSSCSRQSMSKNIFISS